MNRDAVDANRLLRIAAVLIGLCAVACVALQFEPEIGAANDRLAGDRDALRSDEVTISSLPELERDRSLLAARYGRATGNAAARFLSFLAGAARRHDVRVVMTSFKRDVVAPNAAGVSAGDRDARYFTSDELTVTLAGPYRQLLYAIGDLSTGSQIVRVGQPNLTRDENGVLATIPLAILTPAGDAP